MAEFIKSPLDLAQRYASELIEGGVLDTFDTTEEELKALSELDEYGLNAGAFEGTYIVQAGRSIALPADFTDDDNVHGEEYEGILFAGELKTHSVVRIGRRLGGQSMRAVCLAFENVRTLSYSEPIPESSLLHVPALAVVEMDKLAA
jgi:hypothetical protein